METRIIKANARQLSFIETLEASCFEPFQQSTRRALRHSLSSPFQHVAIVQIKLKKWVDAGAVILHIHKHRLRLYSIAVLAEHRHAQLGKLLMDYCQAFGKRKAFDTLSLEALASNQTLIGWYESFGFKQIGHLPHYYAENQHAVKMALKLKTEKLGSATANIIVVDKPKQFLLQSADIDVISAKQYISNSRYKQMKNARVFNLCGSYKYQSEGYYVSLLASARDHRVFPSVTTIGDYKNLTIIKSVSSEIDHLIQKTLENHPDSKYSIKIFFGQCDNSNFKKLASKLYTIFEIPLVLIEFIKNKQWQIQRVTPINFNKLADEEKLQLQSYADVFFARKRFHRPRLKNYKYDLAILVNPNEKTPPSCPKALDKFKTAADKCGFYTEFITKDDYNRLSEFDALFIRETTSVNNYTYMFSRLAYAEGLVVIDDPWSILRCSNKIYLQERMLLNKIPVPDAHILSKWNYSGSEHKNVQFPLVLKQPDGSFSVGINKVNDAQEMETALKKLFKHSDLIIAQSFLPSDFDWRIGIIDQKPLFACKYFMAKGHWQIYNWQGKLEEQSGDHITVPINEVPENVLSAALKASSLMGDGFYGVDLKEINGKVYIIEVNDNPNVDFGIEDAVLKDELYLRIMESILNRIEMSRNISRFISADPQRLPPLKLP